MDFSNVLAPGKIGALELKNRFVVPPMGTNYSNMDGTVSDRLIEHYAGMARGGFGLIIVEFAPVDTQGKVLPGQNGLWGDECIAGNRRMVEEVHRQGAKIAVQTGPRRPADGLGHNRSAHRGALAPPLPLYSGNAS